MCKEANEKKEQLVEPIGVLAVDAARAAACVSVSERTWWRLDSSGKTPPGFMLGGRRLWRRGDLEHWADWGFPDRQEFIARRKAMEQN